ncbi:MAG TPA: sigma-54-dependent Fis family transcriptional regulator [Deltaproteobacteria bacterium]|nr:MAG: hypothetical protein A2048_07980 [Deltaproteobacteria bacterium GWA2_45_12]HBF13378.1 sigma-54-dependent Fis family transcriptional regulator [Deltaproteobacteria bacterium]
MNSKKILLIEDDPTLRNAIEAFLIKQGYELRVYDNVSKAMKEVGPDCHLILSDVMMPGLTGYDLLGYVRKHFPTIPVILMTGYGTIEKAVEAMKNGAYDFLIKPFSLNVLEMALKSAFLDFPHDLPGETKNTEKYPTAQIKASDRFLASNIKMKEILSNLRRIAQSKATVLIQGESGTGKELIAQMIHEFSPRANRIFVAINCAAMPDTLLESELFGHEKGSFTGAVARQIGKFELSNNGTILLDEISEMSLSMQTKLLRVLQECEIYRVGGTQPVPLNLRVICTTNRDLHQYTKQGNFREDLYYRINVIPITLPPLRERGDDVLFMAREMINEFSILHARKSPELDESAKQKILSHPWVGNVRELRNAMERAVLVGSFDVIENGAILLPNEKTNRISQGPAADYVEPGLSLAEIEKRVILTTLDRFHGNRTKTANELGISLRTLRNKLKTYGVAGDSMSGKLDAI